jgi:uncharacterized protein (DUF2249 family)
VIRRGDRVADVIAGDPGLIDVFAAAAPAFERLRNPALRRVMARLVTVEQAARVAGLDPDELVARLNGGSGAPAPRPDQGEPMSSQHLESERPAALRGLDPRLIVDLDVRSDLRSGREPFSRIMEARRALPAGGVLRLRAIFEPVPLYAVFHRQGFRHWTEHRAQDDWVVWFYPADPAAAAAGDPPADPGIAGPAAPAGARPVDGEAGVVVLDVRGLEPPEPMLRTLAALEALPPDHTLVQINIKEPRFLLPRLAERGFTWEVREQEPGLVRVFIRRRRSGDDG